MVRDTLILLRLQSLHRIVQEEVDQDGVDPVCLVGFSSGRFFRAFIVLRLPRLRVFYPFLSSDFHLRVPLLDLPLNQLNAPDTRTAQLNLPVRAWRHRLQAADVRVQGR